jgi:hypothetical protein
MPIHTTYSCKNICGPTSRCSITGNQCLADLDCPGCQPFEKKIKNNQTYSIPAYNDAGKIGPLGLSFSTLTTDIGTQAASFSKKNEKPQQPSLGVNIWKKKWRKENSLFQKKYVTNPDYIHSYQMMGDFKQSKPIPSNL